MQLWQTLAQESWAPSGMPMMLGSPALYRAVIMLCSPAPRCDLIPVMKLSTVSHLPAYYSMAFTGAVEQARS